MPQTVHDLRSNAMELQTACFQNTTGST